MRANLPVRSASDIPSVMSASDEKRAEYLLMKMMRMTMIEEDVDHDPYVVNAVSTYMCETRAA